MTDHTFDVDRFNAEQEEACHQINERIAQLEAEIAVLRAGLIAMRERGKCVGDLPERYHALIDEAIASTGSEAADVAGIENVGDAGDSVTERVNKILARLAGDTQSKEA